MNFRKGDMVHDVSGQLMEIVKKTKYGKDQDGYETKCHYQGKAIFSIYPANQLYPPVSSQELQSMIYRLQVQGELAGPRVGGIGGTDTSGMAYANATLAMDHVVRIIREAEAESKAKPQVKLIEVTTDDIATGERTKSVPFDGVPVKVSRLKKKTRRRAS